MADQANPSAVTVQQPQPGQAQAVNNVEADADSSYGGGDDFSETTSINSAISKGYIENGRRYQAVREGKYWGPSDEKQFESMTMAHLLMLILDSQQSNTLFRSPLSSKAQNVLDIGTGDGAWALDVADHHTNVTVRAVDLFPPPVPWTAPNCIFEVEDVTQEWTWKNRFDLIHMRHMAAAFTPEQWIALYQRCYDNLEPGGWIEHVEGVPNISCDDGTMPGDSILANLGHLCISSCEKSGRPLDNIHTMRRDIEAAGFINLQERDYKCPIGNWPKLQVYKDAGQVNMQMWKTGLEGWVMFNLTHFGIPEPWSAEKVQAYIAKAKEELTQGWHIWMPTKRIWAQKPYEKKKDVDAESLGILN